MGAHSYTHILVLEGGSRVSSLERHPPPLSPIEFLPQCWTWPSPRHCGACCSAARATRGSRRRVCASPGPPPPLRPSPASCDRSGAPHPSNAPLAPLLQDVRAAAAAAGTGGSVRWDLVKALAAHERQHDGDAAPTLQQVSDYCFCGGEWVGRRRALLSQQAAPAPALTPPLLQLCRGSGLAFPAPPKPQGKPPELQRRLDELRAALEQQQYDRMVSDVTQVKKRRELCCVRGRVQHLANIAAHQRCRTVQPLPLPHPLHVTAASSPPQPCSTSGARRRPRRAAWRPTASRCRLACTCLQ